MDNHFLPIEPKKDTTITNKRQIERGAISKAIYMVTDLFEEKEPLRSALRDAAVDMLRYEGSEATNRLKSLLVLSKEVGLVAQINVDILLRAINSVEESVHIREQNLDISHVLKFESRDDRSADGEVKNNSMPEAQNEDKAYQNPKKEVEAIDIIAKVEKPLQASPIVTTLDIGTRRKKILEVVRSKGQATIHEFIESIQGCSSKTIQRELTSLVLSGTLKKTGERRWSKYSLR
ncbi:MAG: hypothetical protein V4576_00330 [Patescibacteria group bacterium]